MASSTMSSGCTEQITAASPIFNSIHAPIDGEAQTKIIDILETLPHQLSHQDGESVLVLLWAPKKIGDVSVLTTCMPFRLYGNNKELEEYYLAACLNHKLYVYRGAKGEAAFGLAGGAYLSCTPEQTQDAAIFTKKWGAFAVPVIEANKCVGVLEFIMDTPRDYSNDILEVQRLIERAGFQTSIQFDRPRRTYLHPKKIIRKSKSFDKTKYCNLVPLFGLSSARAAKILKLNKSTFRNVCRRVGIPEWPYIRISTARDSVSPNADSISISDGGFPELSMEENMTSDSDSWLPVDSMYDEEMSINDHHLNADLNSIRDQVFPVWPLEQPMSGDFEPRNESGYGYGMEYQGYNNSVLIIEEGFNIDDIWAAC